MHLVLALGTHNNRLAFTYGHRYYLVSYVYRKALDDITAHGVHPDIFLLDSGAFSAWTSGTVIDVDAYGAYAETITARWPHTHTINLDVIPGTPDTQATDAQREEGMARSLVNADRLRARGLRVMEVYHQGEPATFLETLVARRRPGELLGLSSRLGLSPVARARWLTNVLRWMVHHGGLQSIPPCHGLAETANESMEAFPFYSTDSSTWIAAQRYGHVIAPSRRTGRPAQQDIVAVYGGIRGPRTRSGLRAGDPTHARILEASTRESIRAIQAEVDRCTAMWAARGITWPVTLTEEPTHVP
jgi:hypothetical protein